MGLVRDGKNHMGLEDDLELRRRLIKMKCADDDTKFVVTHFSHNGGLLQDEMQEKISEFGMISAYDGIEIII
jgi:phosphoribosyl 1,2-cyclic phosphate phosphodiesterase